MKRFHLSWCQPIFFTSWYIYVWLMKLDLQWKMQLTMVCVSRYISPSSFIHASAWRADRSKRQNCCVWSRRFFFDVQNSSTWFSWVRSRSNMTLTLASGPRKLDSVGFRKYCRLRFEYFRKVSAVRLKNNWQDREALSIERPPSLSALEITQG